MVGKSLLKGVISVIALCIFSVVAFILGAPQLGQKPSGADLQRIEKSPHYVQEQFPYMTKNNQKVSFADKIKFLKILITGVKDGRPDDKLPSVKMEEGNNSQESFLTWFGHSTFLYEVGGKKILFDPMLTEHASPFPFGVERYDYDLPSSAEDLPYLDYVIVSHDHYDHLDYKTVQILTAKVGKFLVPLGIGSHLKRWGVSAESIIEFDWGDQYSDSDLTITAVQSRHYSGRTFGDRLKTLWAAWIVEGSDTRVFFGGDSGYFDGFAKHGKEYGPFDLTLLDAGQYDKLWATSHMTPEQSVQAHRDLGGGVYMPIHWSAFTLAAHPWTEPVEWALREALEHDIDMITPTIGERFHVKNDRPRQTWWRNLGDASATSELTGDQK